MNQQLLIFLTFLFAIPALASDFALNWKPEPEFGGFYEAQRMGYFKEEGLDIQILPGGAGQPTVQLLANKKVQFAITTGQELLLANAKGIPLVSLFAVYQKNPHALMVRKDRGIRTIEQLLQTEGTIALEMGALYKKWIDAKVLKGNKPKAKIVPYTGGIQMFLKDPSFAQQCYLFSEPLAVRFSKPKPEYEVQVLPIGETGFDPYEEVVAVHRDTVTAKRDEVLKFRRAIEKGWRTYLADPKATNQAMLNLSPGATEEFYEEYAKVQKPYIEATPVGKQDPEHWKKTANQLKELGVLSTVPNINEILFP
jgi:NitT/TauT family transport system substrate-binding protein